MPKKTILFFWVISQSEVTCKDEVDKEREGGAKPRG
jgi:hypothetical protein